MIISILLKKEKQERNLSSLSVYHATPESIVHLSRFNS